MHTYYAPTFAGNLYRCAALDEILRDTIYWSLSREFRDHSASRDLEPEIDRLDSYDSSIEWVAEPGAQLDDLDLAVLAVLGFRLCWVKYRDGSPERFYVCEAQP